MKKLSISPEHFSALYTYFLSLRAEKKLPRSCDFLFYTIKLCCLNCSMEKPFFARSRRHQWSVAHRSCLLAHFDVRAEAQHNEVTWKKEAFRSV